ncbi:MAG: glycosyltransferase [Eubacterium sp.]|nr:glycosyltransferase [Eubacterium sp.]
MKMISIVTPCYNEEDNIEAVISAVRDIMGRLTQYRYEHILIDNHSTDDTWKKIKKAASDDSHIKAIRNARNFGPLRSIAYAVFQAQGDASILLACDLQDPPSLIPDFIEKWENGYQVIFGKKTKSEENPLMYAVRGLYYKIIRFFAETPEFEQTTGFGLYDKSVIRQLEELYEPVPSFRHLIADLGYDVAFIEYKQPKRVHGKSSYNFFGYFDYALSSLINTSRVPLKLAAFLGLITSFVSLITAVVYFVWKITNWMYFDTGQAPLLIGIFFIGGVLLLFLGIIGEYVGEILTRVTKRPLIIEQERVNFQNSSICESVNAIRHTGIYVKNIIQMGNFYKEVFDMHMICNQETDSNPLLDELLELPDAEIQTTKLITEYGRIAGQGDMIELVKVIHTNVQKHDVNISLAASGHPISDTGTAHIAFGVHRIENVLTKIITNGGEKKTSIYKMANGNKCCFATDPEGNWIELIERKKAV